MLLTNTHSRAVIVLLSLVVSVSVLMIAYFTELQAHRMIEQIVTGKENEVSVLASRTSLRLSDAATILTIASGLPEIASLPNASLIKPTEH